MAKNDFNIEEAMKAVKKLQNEDKVKKPVPFDELLLKTIDVKSRKKGKVIKK